MTMNTQRFHNQREAQYIASKSGKAFLIDAPAGYGKTAFFQALERKYENREWRLISISLAGVNSKEEIIKQLSMKLWPEDMSRHPKPTSNNHLDDMLYYLFYDQPVILLFDDLDRASDTEIVQWVLGDFARKLKKRLSDIYNKQFRLFFATRTLHKFLERQSLPIGQFVDLYLKPFDHDTVKIIAEEISNERIKEKFRKEEEYITWLVHRIIRLSGGHPVSCLALLSEINDGTWRPVADTLDDTDKKMFEKHVQKELDKILKHVDSDLLQVIRRLSIYRLANENTTASVLPEGFDVNRKVVSELMLMNICDDNYRVDPVIHYGLTAQMLFEDENKYRQENRKAQEQYQDWIRKAPEYGLKKYKEVAEEICECVYHCLCSGRGRTELDICIRTNYEILKQILKRDNEVNISAEMILATHFNNDEAITSLLTTHKMPDVEDLLLECKRFVVDTSKNELDTLRPISDIDQRPLITQPPSPTMPELTILFVASDPSDAANLQIGKEFREIQDQLKSGRQKDHIHLQLPQLSVRSTDISRALLDYQPHIVHFSGHSDKGALVFENLSGASQPVAPTALAALFARFASQVRCVLLNGCFTMPQAEAIHQHIPLVIGTRNDISDRAAIAFSVGFYQALAAGKSIVDAFELGRVQIELQGFDESNTPVLLHKA